MARSTVILGVIAAALLAFILLHERDLLSSTELEQRKNRVLTTFVKDRLSRVEIVRGGQTIVLERSPSADPEQEGALGPWKQTAPMQVAVDQEAVDVLLGELEWLQPRRVLEGISDLDRKRFGITNPRVEVRFTIGKQRSVLRVGGDDPTGIGLYAGGDDPDVAYIVGKDLFEALDHDAGHFHTKELHSGIFLFASSAVVVRVAQAEKRAEFRDGTWWLDMPTKSILSSGEVESLIKGLDQLRAKRFVAAAIEGPLSYGLDAPSLVLTVERARSTDADKKASMPVTLRVGASCDSHADEKYLQVNAGPVMCAATADLDKLARPLSELVDRSPFPVDPERLVEITLQAPSRTIVLSKVEERWQYRVAVGGKQSSAGDADREAVTEWMKALRGLQFAARDEVAPVGVELVTLKLKSSGTGAHAVVRVVVGDDGAVHVLRDGETNWLRYDASNVTALTPVVARFRSLALIDAADAPLTSVTVTRGESTEAAARSGDRWLLTAPLSADADPVTLADVAHLLTGLSAVRFVADAPALEHGFDGRSAVRVVFKIGATERTLLLGAPADGGVFSQLVGDDAVFVVPTRVLETVTSGFLAKTSLATPAEDVASLTFEAAGRTYAIKKEGARFVAVLPMPDSAPATSAVERVARLRAEALLHYGSALPAEGFTRPRLRIVVERLTAAGPARHEILFGASTGASDAPQVFVRRSDLAATLTVAQAAFDHLLEIAQ